jgi:hypothetical protein
MAAKFKTKRTSITTMGAKIQAFDIFQTPLSSHYPLPLNEKVPCDPDMEYLRVFTVKEAHTKESLIPHNPA